MSSKETPHKPASPAHNDDILRTFFYENGFSQDLCKQILAAHWDPQRTTEYVALQEQYLPGFKNYKPKTLQALGQIPENIWIRQHLHELLTRFNARHYQFEATHLSEVQLITLKEGEAIDWYSNIGLGPFALRKICLFIILSERSAYEGGRIHSLVKSAPQSQGAIVVAPSIATLCIQPVTQGELKLLFTTLDGDRPFR